MPGARQVNATISFFDVGADVAVLHAESYGIKPITAYTYDLAEKEQMWNIGYAGMAAGELMSYSGFFVRYRKDTSLVSSALALSGMSGGAAVRCVGSKLELVGVVTALMQHAVQVEVWTDPETQIVHSDKTLVNKGISIIRPLRFQLSE